MKKVTTFDAIKKKIRGWYQCWFGHCGRRRCRRMRRNILDLLKKEESKIFISQEEREPLE